MTDRSAGCGVVLGRPVWGPQLLLQDLELRLGLSSSESPASERVPAWARRMDATLAEGPFYRRSFEVDRVGTASTLLRWRDDLIEAGWNGEPIPGGGERLAALAAIESALPDEALPRGRVDRVRLVESEVCTASVAIYEELTLTEDRALWPLRWQRIFEHLEARGTTFAKFTPDLPGASANTDLGRLQQMLRGERAERAFRNDGSLLLVRGDTATELAELTASLLTKHPRDTVVVRGRDVAPLEGALARFGLAQQGYSCRSKWRPATQVLPLAVELAFEPRDPFRVLELLTLSVGPFRGALGRALARAVSRQPGMGGQEWLRQRERAAGQMRDWCTRREVERGTTEAEAIELADAYVTQRLQRLSEWLEAPGAPTDGATHEQVMKVAVRVRGWLQKRAANDTSGTYSAAYGQARAFADAIAQDPRPRLTQEEVRHVLDDLARAAEDHDVSTEEAGRIPHVNHPQRF